MQIINVAVLDESGEKVRRLDEEQAKLVLQTPARKRKAALLSNSLPLAIDPEDADVSLVLDGMGDAEAWQEFRDFLS
jgi:hypothetical protein